MSNIHVVLLGDSTLDNDAYVPANQAVINHLQRLAPSGWKATLLAVDGSTTETLPSQLARLPADATHLIVSVGGNDALQYSGILGLGAKSVSDVLGMLADIGEEFESDYHGMLADVLSHNLPTALCAVYYPNFPDPTLQRVSTIASTIFNDVIVRAAVGAGLPLIDFRPMFNDKADYANAIEPSGQGAEKIARAVIALVTQHDFSRRRTEVFV